MMLSSLPQLYSSIDAEWLNESAVHLMQREPTQRIFLDLFAVLRRHRKVFKRQKFITCTYISNKIKTHKSHQRVVLAVSPR